MEVSAEVFPGRRWGTPAEVLRLLMLYAVGRSAPAPTDRLQTVGEVLAAWVAAIRERVDLAPTTCRVSEDRARMLAADPRLAALSTAAPAEGLLEDARDRLLRTHARPPWPPGWSCCAEPGPGRAAGAT